MLERERKETIRAHGLWNREPEALETENSEWKRKALRRFSRVD